MPKRQVMIRLDEGVARALKVIAAKRDETITAIVLEAMVSTYPEVRDAYLAACREVKKANARKTDNGKRK